MSRYTVSTSRFAGSLHALKIRSQAKPTQVYLGLEEIFRLVQCGRQTDVIQKSSARLKNVVAFFKLNSSRSGTVYMNDR